jgi:hypothetical protein
VKLRGTLTENTMPCFSPNKISWNLETRWRIFVRASLFAAGCRIATVLESPSTTTRHDEAWGSVLLSCETPHWSYRLSSSPKTCEEKQALVRFMQAISSGRGCIATEGASHAGWLASLLLHCHVAILHHSPPRRWGRGWPIFSTYIRKRNNELVSTKVSWNKVTRLMHAMHSLW